MQVDTQPICLLASGRSRKDQAEDGVGNIDDEVLTTLQSFPDAARKHIPWSWDFLAIDMPGGGRKKGKRYWKNNPC